MKEFNVSVSVVPSLSELSALDQERFMEKFRGTPVERIGFERFTRNVKAVVKNGSAGTPSPYLCRQFPMVGQGPMALPHKKRDC
jgi:epoxyqueuosine reductase QueG